MNRLVYSALAIICFAIVSCTEGTLIPDYGQDHIVLNVCNSPMTLSVNDPGTDYERQLNRLDCFFYVKDKTDEPCVYYHKAEVNDLGSATIPFIVDDLVLKTIFPSGSLCDVFVIANLPGEHTFAAKTQETTMQALGKFVLDMTEGEYDVVGKPFVMTGHSKVQKGNNSNASADITLARVASKVTMTVKVPKSIEVANGSSKVKMVPVLVDNEGNEPLKTSFRYGTTKSYLGGAYPDDSGNYIYTDKISYTQSTETDEHYVFTCDMPFYTYARSWERGADNAAYVTFEMPWGADANNDGKADSYKTYYYQILVNGKDRNFKPNTCYEMIVTVGVLGSTVEALPKELDKLSYYVLDWTTESSNGEYGSGDRQEDVEIDKYNYLEVPQKYIEMDNVNTVAIRYNASHKIGVKFDTKGEKRVEGLSGTTDLSALYIANGSGTPAAVKMDDIILKDATKPDVEETNVVSQFADGGKGWLTFNYTLDSGIYSPAYVFITIWLDVDGDGVHDSDEVLTEDVTIVIYPAIYIIGEKSAHFSVFVNGNYNSNKTNTNLNNLPYYSINGQQVGKAVGYDSDDPNQHMHIISVSSFNDKNYQFSLKGTDYRYIIGDPRSRESNTFGVADGGNGWVKAKSADGGEDRYLTNYYPTSTEDGAFQMIAPKFRISSKLAGYSHCSTQGAAYRCASYQEDGYPAGRWRLPTTAEVLFVVGLQEKGKIQDLFVGSSNYCSATHTINTAKNNNTYTLTIWDGIVLANNKTTVSVRCVYDEWYWGSEKEAVENSRYPGGYEFTWGDRKVY